MMASADGMIVSWSEPLDQKIFFPSDSDTEFLSFEGETCINERLGVHSPMVRLEPIPK
jgi:hypothetical protein